MGIRTIKGAKAPFIVGFGVEADRSRRCGRPILVLRPTDLGVEADLRVGLFFLGTGLYFVADT
jgi:hypothetical protein